MVIGAKIGRPVPAEDTFDADNHIFDEGKDQLEKQFRVGFDIRMDNDFSPMIQDADIHFSGMKIGTAVLLVQLIVKFEVNESLGFHYILHLKEGHNLYRINPRDRLQRRVISGVKWKK